MRSEQEVERAIKGLRWETPPEVDGQVVRDGLQALDEALGARAKSREAEQDLASRRPARQGGVVGALLVHWRASAAVALAAVASFVGYVALVSRSALTMAEVMAAVNEQPWVHIKYDNGREEWASLRDDLCYYKSEHGRVVFLDCVRGIRQAYSPEYSEGYISEDGITPFSLGRTPWEFAVGHFEGATKGLSRYSDAERHPDTVDGKKAVRFDVYYKDPLGGRLLTTQVWVDPESRLPVRIRKRLQLAEREKQKREFITGEYDFPDSGPSSIYDLGVPHDLPVVNLEKKVTEPDVQELVEASKKAQQAFPERYRAVIWPEKRGEIEIIYRDGQKIRCQYYFNLGPESPEYHLPLPATVEEVLEWTPGQIPVHLGIFDGETMYLKTGPLPAPFKDQPEPTVRVGRGNLLNSSNWPHVYQWPTVHLRAPEKLPGTIPGCIGLRWEAGNRRGDYYVDPEKDYLCINEVWWEKRNGSWQKAREYWLSDLARLPGGRWYATKRHLITFGNPERGISRGGVIWNINIKVLQEDEFPADCFNGKPLLEGVKVETY